MVEAGNRKIEIGGEMKFKIKCYSEKEAVKLFEMLDELKQKEYIGEGEIDQNKNIVIFKTKETRVR